MGLCSCTAKCLVGIFALLVFCVGVALLGVGIFAVTRLRDYIPIGPTPWFLIGIGVVVLFLGIAGITTMCCPKRRKRSLCVMIVLTTLAFALSGVATGFGFYYEEIMETAFKNGFGDEADGAEKSLNDLEKHFYHGMRDTFNDLYVDCEPTSYTTKQVHKECVEAKNNGSSVTVEACASDDYPADLVGLYCKKGPGLDDFTIDKAMSFPDPDKSLKISDLLETRSFGYFANYVCMPTQERYNEMYGEVVKITAGGQSNTTFGSCYASKWWSDAPPPLTKGETFTTQPDGTPLTPGQQDFFEALDSSPPGPQWMSDKLVFCFCSDKGTDSTLYSFLKKASEYSKWISLGATIFFLLVFIAECYLCCCYKDQSDRQMGKQLTVLRP